MKLIKSQKIGVLCRTIERDQQFHFCVGGMLYFHVDHPRTLLSEMGLWKTVPKILGKDCVLDEMIAKSRAEFLVAGKAFSSTGQPTTAVPVKVRVGSLEKQLAVVGDRVWKNQIQSQPVPFVEMPIRWDAAFGGEGFLENPTGKGYHKGKVDDQKPVPLPNIEYPGKLIKKPTDTPKPAGFMPLDISWSFRQTKSGTYDEKWLKELFPGTAKDIDWTMFNLAPDDQWLKNGFFQGDETFTIENMHPTRPKIEGKLPGAVVRCFVTQKVGDQEHFRDVPMKIDTIWFFPEQERAIVIYRGVVQVADDDAPDIVHLVLACEDPKAPRTEEHYQEIVRRRTDRKNAVFEMFNEAGLVPDWPQDEVADFPDEMASLKGRGLLKANLAKKNLRLILKARAEVVAEGLDPDEHGPKLPSPDPQIPPVDQLPGFIEKIMQEAEEKKAQALQKQKDEAAQNRAIFEKHGLDYSVIEKEQAEPLRGPPTFRAQERLDYLAGVKAQADANKIPVPDVEHMLTDPKFKQMLVDAERGGRDLYRKNAHMQYPAFSRSSEDSSNLLRWLLDAYNRLGRSFPNIDLTGADLRTANVPGIDLHDSLMESVDLSAANLSSADLRNTVLAHTRLVGTDLRNANLSGANLGSSLITDADFRGANLSQVIFTKSDLSNAKLSDADLTGADISEAVLTGAVFERVKAVDLTFSKTKFENMSFAAADLTNADFVECTFVNVDFSHAKMGKVGFFTCKGENVKFGGASMDNVRFALESEFVNCDFRGASMLGSGLRETNFNGCDFGGAKLSESDMASCLFRKAKFVLAQMIDTVMIKCDVTDADFTRANLRGSLLTKATIEGAQFLEANLFQVDMARVKSSPKTATTGAILKKVRIYPLRKPQK